MKRTHSTKRTLLASLLCLVLCFAMFVSTTFAWFTDSVTSANNIIQAGNLDIEMYWAEGEDAVPADENGWTDASTTAIFDYDNWEPGFVQVRHVKIENKGSLALKYKVKIAATGTVSDLSDAIDVYYVDPAVQVTDRTQLTDDNKLGSLTQVLAGLDESGNGTLEAGKSDTITIALKMREDAGNEYQEKSIGSSFAVQVLATQFNSESDSFNSSYDINADYDEGTGSQTPPLVYVSTAADLKAALTPTISNDAATVVLTNDITLADGETWTPLDLEAYTGTVRNIVIDGQGHTIKGLDAPLLGNCYFGNTSVVIKNLTLANSTIENKHYNGLGSGAFIAYADNSKSVELVNCHLVDSTITATEDFTGIGGLIGYSSSPLTITDCSVTNCTINGAQNSAGAIAGHVSAGYDTTITNAKVVGCTVKGERADKTGYVVGTANNGDTVITTNAACANNTVFDVANSATIYGRLSGGTLTVNGVAQ